MSNQFIALILLSFCLSNLVTAQIHKVPVGKKTNGGKSTGYSTFYSDETSDNESVTTVMRNFYFGSVTVGSNNQVMDFIFDTGSWYIWIAAPQASADGYTHTFDCQQSSTCTTTNQEGQIAYGIGEVEGLWSADTVIFGDITSTAQPFIYATTASGCPTFLSGLIGFGNSMFNGDKTNTLLSHLKSIGAIQSQSFSLYLAPDTNFDTADYSDVSTDTLVGGELVIGGYDETHMGGESFAYIPVVEIGYWAVQLSAATFGNANLDIQYAYPSNVDPFWNGTFSPNRALIDSGTSGLLIPGTDNLDMMYEELTNAGYTCEYDSQAMMFFCECKSQGMENIPDMTVTLGGTTFTLPHTTYTILIEQTCILPIMSGNVNNNMWILGDPFLRQYYVHFDIDNQRVGIVTAANNQN